MRVNCCSIFCVYKKALNLFKCFAPPGPVEQGAVGVSISIFNLVSKMFNLPLLNVTTSFVAEDASDKEILSDVTEVPLEPTSPTSATLLFMEGKLP
jgi:hypothetical protein